MSDFQGKARAEGRRFWNRTVAAWTAYPFVLIAVYLAGRWTAWIPLPWGL